MSIRTPERHLVPEDREALYRAKGYWADDWLGGIVSAGLSKYADCEFHLHSRVRPFHGTIGTLADAARRLAGELDRRGIGPGDVVAYQLPNSAESAIVFWGATMTGAVIAPIVHTYGRREVRYILEDSGAKAFFAPESFRGHGFSEILSDAASLPTTEVVSVVGKAGASSGVESFTSLTTGAPLVNLPDDIDPASPALLAYTSGTTANPKGVLHSHRGIIFDTQQLPTVSNPRPRIIVAPVGHFTGMFAALFTPIHSGGDVHMMDVFEPAYVLQIMRDYSVGISGGATFFLSSMLDCPEFVESDAKLIDEMSLGGATIPNHVIDRAAALGIRISRIYGSTEHPTITFTQPSISDPSRFTDGTPHAGVELRIVDDLGRDVGQGQEGEIWSRGPDLFLGYTDQALTDSVADEDGWYHTGDLAVRDANGNVVISGRKSDMIIRGGENISALEVEEVLLALPEVREVAVVGLPDDRYGEVVCAVVVLEPEAQAPKLEQIRESCEAAELGYQKWPERVVVASELPRTASGKIKKAVLRTELAGNSLQSSPVSFTVVTPTVRTPGLA